MGQYNTAIVTQQGQQILAEAVGAQQVITFTSVKTSSHSYSSETDLTTLTGLQDIMQSVSPSSAAVTNGNIVEVTARFDNAGVQNEYQIQTIGLYGKTQNGEETLIAVVKAVTPDTMPDSAYSPIAYIYNIQLTIQSGESVAVTVNPAGTATVQDVLELQQTIATLQQNVNEQIAQLNSDIQERVVFRQNNKDINVSVNANNDNRVYINASYNSEQFQLIFDFVDHVFRFANNHSGTWDDICLNESGIQRLAGAIRVFSGNSLDTNITPGVYAVDSSVSNLPISTYGLMIVIKYLNSNWIFNFFIPTDLTRLYINFYNGYGSAGWSGWKHVDFIAS